MRFVVGLGTQQTLQEMRAGRALRDSLVSKYASSLVLEDIAAQRAAQQACGKCVQCLPHRPILFLLCCPHTFLCLVCCCPCSAAAADQVSIAAPHSSNSQSNGPGAPAGDRGRPGGPGSGCTEGVRALQATCHVATRHGACLCCPPVSACSVMMRLLVFFTVLLPSSVLVVCESQGLPGGVGAHVALG
jgi:hypothetical protein